MGGTNHGVGKLLGVGTDSKEGHLKQLSQLRDIISKYLDDNGAAVFTCDQTQTHVHTYHKISKIKQFHIGSFVENEMHIEICELLLPFSKITMPELGTMSAVMSSVEPAAAAAFQVTVALPNPPLLVTFKLIGEFPTRGSIALTSSELAAKLM